MRRTGFARKRIELASSPSLPRRPKRYIVTRSRPEPPSSRRIDTSRQANENPHRRQNGPPASSSRGRSAHHNRHPYAKAVPTTLHDVLSVSLSASPYAISCLLPCHRSCPEMPCCPCSCHAAPVRSRRRWPDATTTTATSSYSPRGNHILKRDSIKKKRLLTLVDHPVVVCRPMNTRYAESS